MPNLIVTFTRTDVGYAFPAPVSRGDAVRTEVIPIDSGTDGLQSTQGTLAAQAGENIVELTADGGDCWYSIGADPTAVTYGSGSRLLHSGSTREHIVTVGHKVAVTGVEA